jgi:transposase InsO family protein
MTRYHTGVPIERVHLDFLGPLPESTSGNTNILAMVDQFTKWVECIALPSQRAEVTARATVNQFFARFGYPFNLFTDQGLNFESRLFKSICEILQIHKIAQRLTVRQQTDKLKGSTEPLWMQYVVL